MPSSYIMIASRPNRVIRGYVLLHHAIGLRGRKTDKVSQGFLAISEERCEGVYACMVVLVFAYASLWLVEFE